MSAANDGTGGGHERPERRHAEITPAELVQWQERGAEVIDVREEFELLRGRIPGARNLPMSRFLEEAGALGERTVVLVCASGSRSRSVAEYLIRSGFPSEVANLTDGMVGWREEGRATEGGLEPGLEPG